MKLHAIFAIVTLLSTMPAFAKESAIDRTKNFISTFKKVKVADEGKQLTSDDKKSNQGVYKELDGYFDYERLTSDPLVPHKGKISTDQNNKIQSIFTELIRRASYPRAGVFFRDAAYELKPGKSATEVEMPATIVKEDFKVKTTYHWQEKAGSLRLVDVSFDGASLVKDYQNQFGRIIAKDGVDGLIKKMQTRLEKLRQEQGD